MTELEIRAGAELDRTMERYTRVRLDPSAAQAKRARSALMEAAWRARIAGPIATPVPASVRGGSRGPFGGWGARRVGVSFAAAVLAGLMVGTTAFATSRAGAPLYDVRVALEELTLPTDAQARLEAELALAQGRLAEIVDGANRDDPGAVAAAVHAYLAALDDLGGATGGPADRALIAVEFHRTILLEVLARVPDDARAGIENALVRSGAVIDRLAQAGTKPSTNGSGAAGAGDNGGGTNGGGAGSGPATTSGTHQGGQPADPGAQPSRDPRPARTSAPTENEKPAKTAVPAGTDGSDEGGGGKP